MVTLLDNVTTFYKKNNLKRKLLNRESAQTGNTGLNKVTSFLF